MDKVTTIIMAGVVSGALAVQELTDPGIEHIEYGTKGGPEQQIGRAAFSVEVTATSVQSSNFIVQEFTRH